MAVKQRQFETGSIVRLRAQFKTPATSVPANQLVDPNVVTLTIRFPNKTQTVYTVDDLTHDGTGMYSFPLSLASDGTYYWRWEGSNGVDKKGVHSGDLDATRNPNF